MVDQNPRFVTTHPHLIPVGTFTGETPSNITAKDMMLALIGKLGAGGGAGYAVEFAGEPILKMKMEGRMTLCNMAVEMSAFSALIEPDKTTLDYLKGRHYSPAGADWEIAEKAWEKLKSGPDATFDKEVRMDISSLTPFVTWGTSPEHSMSVNERIPAIDLVASSAAQTSRKKSLVYMGLEEGMPISGVKLDGAFIGLWDSISYSIVCVGRIIGA